jgi:hypothetical protein
MASGNINTPQGVLNRVAATVVFNGGAPGAGVGGGIVLPANFTITPYFLGREGIRLTLEGNATDYFPTMTGAVPSPAPFQIATLTIALLKTQPTSNQIKAQFENNTLLGQIDVIPDVSVSLNTGAGGTGGVLGKYSLMNCVLESVNAMSFAGEEPTWVITIKGYYEVNAFMFNS